MKRILFLSLFGCLVFTAPNAQVFNTTWGARFQAILDSLTVVYGSDKGVTTALYMPGQGVWAGAAGLSEPGVPMTPDLRVNIGSNSKLFLVVTMLKLQEQHVLSLNDHIGKWLPTPMHDIDSSVSIRQLLGHQSGFFDYVSDRADDYTNEMLSDTSHFFTAEEDVNNIGPALFPPGHGYHYSNTNYALCTMIIKAATGEHYWKKLHELVLDPLGMDQYFCCRL